MCYSKRSEVNETCDRSAAMHTHLTHRKMFQRGLKPHCSTRNLVKMAIWKRAMDVGGPIEKEDIDAVITRATREMKRRAKKL